MKKNCNFLCLALVFLLVCFSFTVSASEKLPSPLVLMYHRISDTLPSDAFTITSSMFESDIKRLTELGYTFCPAEKLQSALKENKTDKLAVITFDDGYSSDVTHALPILEKYKACATFFVIGSKVGTPGYLTELQLKKLADSSVAQIGNHSYNLHNLPYESVNKLCFTNPFWILNDIKKNQETLFQITGQEITAYSYPYGLYGKYLDALLKSEGFITFSSKESLFSTKALPCGRYNRAFDLPVDKIISNIKANQ